MWRDQESPPFPSDSAEWDDPPPSSTADSPISELPDHLIHHIASLLPQRSAAQLYVLSKRFLSAWYSIPCLSFDDSHGGGEKKTALFLPYIRSTLSHRRRLGRKPDKLRIKFTLGSGTAPRLQIKAAIDSAFKTVTRSLDLDFELNLVRRRSFSLQPRNFSSAPSLTSLRLTGFNLHDLVSSDGVLTFSFPLLEDLMLCRCSGVYDLRVSSPKLKSLEIDDCEGLDSLELRRSKEQQLDAASIEKFNSLAPLQLSRILSMQSLSALRLVNFTAAADVLTLSHPLLEDLELSHCWGIETLNVSCPKLKSLGIVSCKGLKSLDLDAQTSNKLRSIRLIQFTPRNNLLEISQENLEAAELDIESSSAVGITVICLKLESLDIKYNEELHSGEIDLSGCHSLRSLRLTRAGITDEWIEKNVSVMAKLERLELDGCLRLEALSVRHKGLESLVVNWCHMLRNIEVDAVKLNHFDCYSNSINLRKLTLRSSDKLVVGFWMPEKMFDASYFDHSIRILKSLEFCNKLKLKAYSVETLTIPKDSRDRRLMMYALGEMEVEFIQRPEMVKSGEIVRLLDSLLWLAPRPRVLSLVYVFVNKTKRLNFRYLKEEVLWLSCCEPESRLKCWRHSLSGVTMTGFEPSEKRELAEYFRSNAVTYVDDDE